MHTPLTGSVDAIVGSVLSSKNQHAIRMRIGLIILSYQRYRKQKKEEIDWIEEANNKCILSSRSDENVGSKKPAKKRRRRRLRDGF